MQWREQRPRLDKENGYRGCLVITFVITHTLRFLFAVLAVRISKCDSPRSAFDGFQDDLFGFSRI